MANFVQPGGSGRNFEIGMVSTNEMYPMDPRNRKNKHLGGLEWVLGLLASGRQKPVPGYFIRPPLALGALIRILVHSDKFIYITIV